MDRTLSKTGFVNWTALLVAAAVVFGFAQNSASATGLVAVAFLLLALFVSLLAWFQSTLWSREEAERLELQDLARTRGQSSLFAESAAEISPARRSRQQFEKWVLPAFTVVLFGVQAYGVWYFWKRFGLPQSDPTAAASSSALSLAIFAAVAFVLFLLGKYSSRLAQLENSRLLRPSASALMLGAVVGATAALAAALDWAGFAAWDRYLALGLTALLGLIATETLVTLLFEIYRPRVPGKEANLIYESRIVGLLGQSGGIFNTAAQALDYQFGFKVSETWFYRYLEQYVAAFALLWVGILWISSAVVVIEPQEEALLERFGRPVTGRQVLGPGIHLKLPWPLDSVDRFNTRELRTFLVGAIPDPELEKNRVLVWTRPHYREEFNLLVASGEDGNLTVAPGDDGGLPEQAVPVNLLTVSVPVQYRVRDVRDWGYQTTDPAGLLERLATSEVVRYLVSVNMDQVMSFGRLEAARDLKQRIQSEADKLRLGVEILFVGLQDIHPPMGTKQVQVAAAYEQVIGAISQKEARILEAEGYRAETLPMALANSIVRTNRAHAAAATRIQDAIGRASQFSGQLLAVEASPRVYPQRAYLETLVKSIRGSRKLVIGPTNTSDVFQFNLEDRIRGDLMNDIAIQNPNQPSNP